MSRVDCTVTSIGLTDQKIQEIIDSMKDAPGITHLTEAQFHAYRNHEDLRSRLEVSETAMGNLQEENAILLEIVRVATFSRRSFRRARKMWKKIKSK